MSGVHKHLLVTGYTYDVMGRDHIGFLRDWFERLVDKVGMEVLISPQIVYCEDPTNEGITGIVCITTSHATIHQWLKQEPFYKFDLYSCKEYLIDDVFDMLKELTTHTVSYTVIDRADESHPKIESGIKIL